MRWILLLALFGLLLPSLSGCSNDSDKAKTGTTATVEKKGAAPPPLPPPPPLKKG